MSRPERYEPRARSIGGPWKMVKCKDGPYVCFEQHEEIVEALAEENKRLRKAGDAMAYLIKNDEVVCYNIFDKDEVIYAWLDAKEGGAK